MMLSHSESLAGSQIMARIPCSQRALVQGLWVHSYMKHCNLEANPILGMYSKCGCVESAVSVFEVINDKDAGEWNALISGVAVDGDARKALELFNLRRPHL